MIIGNLLLARLLFKILKLLKRYHIIKIKDHKYSYNSTLQKNIMKKYINEAIPQFLS